MILYLVILLLAFVFVVVATLSQSDRKLLFGSSSVFNHDGVKRKYRIHFPENVSENPRMIFVFHGFRSDSRQMAYITGFHNAIDENTIVVYPEATKPQSPGLRSGWNAGFCCGTGFVNNVDDVGYIKALKNYLSDEYNVSKNRTFASGFSNGGMFVNRLAAEMPKEFGGFASVAGSIGTETSTITATTPVPFMHIHGEQDTIIPYNGGPGSSDTSFVWQSFATTRSSWEQVNQATGPNSSEINDTLITTYTNSDAPLKILIYKDNSHVWPDWRIRNFWHTQPEGSQSIFSFFESLENEN